MVHLACEYIWKDIQSSQQLLAMTESDLHNLVEKSVTQAFKALSLAYDPFSTTIEKICIINILNQWLDEEKQRQPFKVIKYEHSWKTSINGLTLKLRVDRIDQIHINDKIYTAVIDYKTGSNSVSQWLGDYPAEPQLPLYAITLSDTIDGIAFAEIRLESMSLKGLNNEFNWYHNKDNTITMKKYGLHCWDDLKEHWRTCLNNLAHEFKTGYALIQPRHYPKSCSHCDLQQLCRIHNLEDIQ